MGRQENERERGQERRGSDEAITSPSRGRLVEHLRDREGWIDVADLVEELASAPESDSADSTPEAAPDREAVRRRYRIRLHHVDLPKLADRGIIDWKRRERVVRLSDRIVSEPARQNWAGSGTEQTAEISDPQRRAVLALLREAAPRAVSREQLARELAASDEEAIDEEPTDAAVERCGISLHHCHLPKLSEAGLIHYDSDTGTVSYRGPTESRAAQPAE